MTDKQHNPGMSDQAHADDQQMLDLLQHARDAELLESVVLNRPQLHGLQHSTLGTNHTAFAQSKPEVLAMIRRAGAPVVAAAAAVAFLAWVVISQPAGAPRNAGTLAKVEKQPASKAAEKPMLASGNTTSASTAEASTTQASTSAASNTGARLAPASLAASEDLLPPDMSLMASIDPSAEFGLPSLTEERRMVIAVPLRFASSVDCADWSVVPSRPTSLAHASESDDMSASAQASSDVLSALTSNAIACAADARATAGEDSRIEQVVLFEVQGPRVLLPFHDDDARAMAACLSEAVEVERMGDSTFLLSKCAEFAGVCLPAGLAVSATLVSR